MKEDQDLLVAMNSGEYNPEEHRKQRNQRKVAKRAMAPPEESDRSQKLFAKEMAGTRKEAREASKVLREEKKRIKAEADAGIGQCSTQAICAEGDYCLPAPSGDGKECTQVCDVGQECPDEGDICHVYEEGNTSGACFPAE